MATLVRVTGLNKKGATGYLARGFRIKKASGGYATVTSTNTVEVDIEDAAVQKVLKRNSYRVVAVPTTAYVS